MRCGSARDRAWVGIAALLGTALVGCAGGSSRGRVLPTNAVQPPGGSFAGYPALDGSQKLRLAEDIARDTARQAVRDPFGSALRLVGRGAKRLAVRAVEIAPPLAANPFDRSGSVDGHYGGPTRAARLTFLPGSHEAVDGLIAAIASARTRVDLMIYGWEDDPTGRRVADALAERARAGVRVRLLVDKAAHVIHNPAVAHGGPTFLDRLACVPNVTLIFAPDACVRFDHRKLAVIDDRLAWSGSMILTDVAYRRWRNYSYLAEGPIVADLAAVFAGRWQDVGQPSLGPIRATLPPVVPNARVHLVGTDTDGDRSLKRTIYHAVDHAAHHIYLSNPYFTDEILVDKLVAARRRGVDVRAVLTLRGNIERLNHFSALNANRLLRGGVRVYLYPAMTHVKAMSADGTWAYVGTGNFDELSLRNNREVGLSIAGDAAVAEVDRTLFLPDMAASQEIRDLLPMTAWRRLGLEVFALWY